MKHNVKTEGREYGLQLHGFYTLPSLSDITLHGSLDYGWYLLLEPKRAWSIHSVPIVKPTGSIDKQPPLDPILTIINLIRSLTLFFL